MTTNEPNADVWRQLFASLTCDATVDAAVRRVNAFTLHAPSTSITLVRGYDCFFDYPDRSERARSEKM